MRALFIMFITLCLVTFQRTAQARHIIGGDIFYTCIARDSINNTVTLRVTIQMYRDNRCTTAQEGCALFDGDPRETNRNLTTYEGAFIGVFEEVGQGWRNVEQLQIPPNEIEKVPPNDQPCLDQSTVPNIDVELGVYEFEVTLDISNTNYQIAYMRCCRSESISNLINPGDFGAVFSVDITPEALRTCNNSARFRDFPPLIICAGIDLTELQYDNSAIDEEGDSIVYELCTPLSSGGPNVNATICECNSTPVPLPECCTPSEYRNVQFASPTFTARAPMGGNPVVGIDPVTGQLFGTPTVQGEYVMAICAREYRDGVLLSKIRRDFQFIVSGCSKSVIAKAETDAEQLPSGSAQVLNVRSCGDLEVQFFNRSEGGEDIRDFEWRFDINGNTRIFENVNDPIVQFPELGTYNGLLVLNPDEENCTDSVLVPIAVFSGLEASFNLAYDTCVAGPVRFNDLSFTEDENFIISRDWDFGDNTTIDALSPSHLYQSPGDYEISLLITDNNGCFDDTTTLLNYAPAPNILIIDPSQFIGCTPGEITFNNLSEPIDSNYFIEWNFGDQSAEDNRFEISPTHLYETPGTYTVSVFVESPIGCTAQRTFRNLITILPGPRASYIVQPSVITLENNTVQFTNTSSGQISNLWDFGDGNISLVENPTYTYRDTGIFISSLTVTASNGCTDTATHIIDVVPEGNIRFPNAFTPNGDGRNDVFMGAGNFFLVNDYELTIYDRWGKIVFQTNDPREGWNGRHNNSGALMPPGVYMCSARWREPRGKSFTHEGVATLVR